MNNSLHIILGVVNNPLTLTIFANFCLQDVFWVKMSVELLVMPLAEKMAHVLVELRYDLAFYLVETISRVLSTYLIHFRAVSVPMKEFLQKNLLYVLQNQLVELIVSGEEKLLVNAMAGNVNVFPINLETFKL